MRSFGATLEIGRDARPGRIAKDARIKAKDGQNVVGAAGLLNRLAQGRIVVQAHIAQPEPMKDQFLGSGGICSFHHAVVVVDVVVVVVIIIRGSVAAGNTVNQFLPGGKTLHQDRIAGKEHEEDKEPTAEAIT